MMQYDRYIGWTILRTFLVIAAGLTALFSLLSFVEQLGLVGEGHYRVLDALAYTVLTAPDRLLQLAPVAMLLATLLGLAKLARGSELTALCSFGVSEAGIIGAVSTVPDRAIHHPAGSAGGPAPASGGAGRCPAWPVRRRLLDREGRHLPECTEFQRG
jgi:hypothetical protein